jgi:uroporphyrin-III C-methyltransferase
MQCNPQLTLVGAGPGDPELITIKAVRALQTADVILYDALANEELLNYAKPAAIKRFVGKRYGCHFLSQDAINAMIIEMAFAYGHVVRLKGGDPFVFGHAQEEIDHARAFDIPVKVIPGISSALAVPASQMIPLTARGMSESFWVTTGTTRAGDLSNDIALAAQSSATVVILMAMSKLEQIISIFTQSGKADTAVAIIQDGTTPKEKILLGTVADILVKNKQAGLSNPAIIIIGNVVNLHPDLVPELVEKYEKKIVEKTFISDTF